MLNTRNSDSVNELLDLVSVPPRLSLMLRDNLSVAYNPSLNVWHAVDDIQAEILRWLRAGRSKSELCGHIARRFGISEDVAHSGVRQSLEHLILRHLLILRPAEPEIDAVPEFPLSSVYWIATQACNLRCTYCYQEAALKRPAELTTEEALDLVRQVKEVGAPVFVITGGEPFARNDLLDVVRYARSLDLTVNVITNGHYVNGANAQEIADLFDRISISIDHGKPEHHDRHRGQGSWKKSRTAIDLLLQAGANIDVNSTLSREGSADLRGLLSLRSDKRIGLHRIVPQYPMGRGREGGNDPLTPDELLSIDDKIYEAGKSLAEEQGQSAKPRNRMLAGKGQRRVHCGAGLSEVSVDPEGWVYPCRLLQYDKYQGDNLRTTSLKEIIFKNANIGRVRNSTASMLRQCSTCVIRNYCGGGCRGIHASFTNDAGESHPLFCSHLRRSFELQAWESTGYVPKPRNVRFATGHAGGLDSQLVNITFAPARPDSLGVDPAQPDAHRAESQ